MRLHLVECFLTLTHALAPIGDIMLGVVIESHKLSGYGSSSSPVPSVYQRNVSRFIEQGFCTDKFEVVKGYGLGKVWVRLLFSVGKSLDARYTVPMRGEHQAGVDAIDSCVQSRLRRMR